MIESIKSPDDLKSIIDTYGSFLSVSDMSKIMGVSSRSIYNYSAKYNWDSFRFRGKRFYRSVDVVDFLFSFFFPSVNDFKNDSEEMRTL